MIVGNGSVFHKCPVFRSGAVIADSKSNFLANGRRRNWFVGSHLVEANGDRKNGMPNGYRAPYCWLMPQKSGSLAIYTDNSGTGLLYNGNLAGGINNQANLSGSGSITQANCGLIISAIATLLGSGQISDASIVGKLEASATLAGEGQLVASIGALAGAIATINSTGSINADINAKAYMSAEITPFTELSPQNLASAVWNALANEFNTTGTMGKKLNDASSSGSPWDDPRALTKSKFLALK